MFMTWCLFLEISENKNTEYLTPTSYINNDYAKETPWRCSLKVAAPSCSYIQRKKTHNFSGVLNIVCGKVCFSSFLVNLQANKPSLCWKDICSIVIFQGFCEYIFKFFGSTCLFGAHSSEWLLPECGKCTGQEHCMKICTKKITEEKIGFFIVLVLFVRGVIFIWGNFTSCFFQSNDKWVYAFNRNIFIFKFYVLLFFYIKILFSLTTTYEIPFLQIHTTIYFILVSCYTINVNQR